MCIVNMLHPFVFDLELRFFFATHWGTWDVIFIGVFHATFRPQASIGTILLRSVKVEDMGAESLQILQFSRTAFPLTYEWNE